MKINYFEFEITVPVDILPSNIRSRIIQHLIKYGEPVRWALTKVEVDQKDISLKILKVEAVLILPSS
tara:strand:- start:415 stop:615 length:201 start_codon:yes stop_codon:yes gene_type:complete